MEARVAVFRSLAENKWYPYFNLVLDEFAYRLRTGRVYTRQYRHDVAGFFL
jgi:hypothetical protein